MARNALKRAAKILLVIGMLIAISIPAFGGSNPPQSRFIAGDVRFHVVGGPNSYVFLANNLYVSKVRIEPQNATYDFTNAALGAASNPTQTFALAGSSNMTLVSINTNTVVITVTSPSTSNTTFFYPNKTIPSNVGFGTTVVPSSKYLTSQSAYNSCVAPCVFLNSANNLIEMKAPSTMSLTINNPPILTTGCGQLSNATGQVSGAVNLLAVGLVVMAAVIVLAIVIAGTSGGGGDGEDTDLTSKAITIVLFAMVLIIGGYIIFSTTGVLSLILGC